MENEKEILGLLKFFWTKRTRFQIVKLLEKQRVWALPSFNDMAGSDPGAAELGLRGRIPLAGEEEISLLSVTRQQMARLGWVGSQASHFSSHLSVADSTLRCGTAPWAGLWQPQWGESPVTARSLRNGSTRVLPALCREKPSSCLHVVACKLFRVISKLFLLWLFSIEAKAIISVIIIVVVSSLRGSKAGK